MTAMGKAADHVDEACDMLMANLTSIPAALARS